jgi:hypothetical protein
MNRVKFFIKDFWEDFHYMNEGSSPKYWVNIVIWYILMILFLILMFIAATLGGIIYNIKHR